VRPAARTLLDEFQTTEASESDLLVDMRCTGTLDWLLLWAVRCGGRSTGLATLLQTRHVYRQPRTGQLYAGGCVRWYGGESVQGLVDVAESVVCQVYGILVHAVR
jgi:hypothetical protein